jgi:hypothetical protein
VTLIVLAAAWGGIGIWMLATGESIYGSGLVVFAALSVWGALRRPTPPREQLTFRMAMEQAQKRAEFRAALARVERFEADRNAAGLIRELDSSLEHRGEAIAGQAALALAALGDARYAEMIRPLAASPSPACRAAAVTALDQLQMLNGSEAQPRP